MYSSHPLASLLGEIEGSSLRDQRYITITAVIIIIISLLLRLRVHGQGEFLLLMLVGLPSFPFLHLLTDRPSYLLA